MCVCFLVKEGKIQLSLNIHHFLHHYVYTQDFMRCFKDAFQYHIQYYNLYVMKDNVCILIDYIDGIKSDK